MRHRLRAGQHSLVREIQGFKASALIKTGFDEGQMGVEHGVGEVPAIEI